MTTSPGISPRYVDSVLNPTYQAAVLSGDKTCFAVVSLSSLLGRNPENFGHQILDGQDFVIAVKCYVQNMEGRYLAKWRVFSLEDGTEVIIFMAQRLSG